MLPVQARVLLERPTVLLVEDEVLIRLMLAEELRAQGLQVVEASNAQEALTVLDSTLPVHLLFTDVRMPGEMDGVALARTARQRFPRLKLVITSSRRPREPIEQVADAFLIKPYDVDGVVARVESLLADIGNDQ
jgi:two-component system, response regulator PdtaR